jgi:thiol-disulfide isomerase/thioredoxin
VKKQFLIVIFLLLGAKASAQLVRINEKPGPAPAGESYIVTDSEGNQYNYDTWHKMVVSGDYNIRRTNAGSEPKEFRLYRYTAEEKADHLKNMRQPPESAYFITGEKIKPFKIHDLYGNTLDAKAWAGKTVVLNFWFTSCKPCQTEIPELNKVAGKYRDNANVIFIGIALDEDFYIKNFIKRTPFGYVLVPDGRHIADMFGIKLYPTNVVIDKEGKIRFHSSGLYTNTAFWIDKTIDESENGITQQ